MTGISRILPLISSGDSSAVNTLAEQGFFDSITAEEKRQLVFTAAQNGQAGMLRFLFEAHHLYSPDPDDQGQTLLHRAAQSGDADTVRFAMDILSFDPLQGDLCGITPLDLARSAEKPDAFQFLTDRLGFSPDQCYRNPVLRGFHPDPSVVRLQEDYYLITSSFFLFPGLPVFHSRDLVHWQEIGHVVTDLGSSGLASLPGGFGYWAPDISFYRGRFWVVATLRRNEKPFRLQMITSAADPRGPWDPPKFLPLDGIDPSLFTDEDGRRYILLNPGAMIAEIDDDGNPVSEPRMISFGSARIKPEGPHLIRRNGWYYLFLAEGGTGEGHMETVLRSKNLYGPYESCPFNPILGRKNLLSPVQRSGHGKPVRLPDGRWYMVYLCSRPVDKMSLLGRETALDPMTWTADGWPMVNSLKGPSCLQALPFPNLPATGSCRESWISPRNDPDRFASVHGRSLILRCGPDPASVNPCSLLLRRQEESVFTQSFHIGMDSADEGDFGGLAGYYDERSFYLFGIRKAGSEYSLVLSEQIGSERKETVLSALSGPSVRLSVRGIGLTRTLSLFRNGAEESIAVIRTAYLCDEGLPEGKRFTGALYGLAAVGTGTVAFQET